MLSVSLGGPAVDGEAFWIAALAPVAVGEVGSAVDGADGAELIAPADGIPGPGVDVPRPIA